MVRYNGHQSRPVEDEAILTRIMLLVCSRQEWQEGLHPQEGPGECFFTVRRIRLSLTTNPNDRTAKSPSLPILPGFRPMTSTPGES